ncbi:MAG: hypothetical protein RLW68_01680 [Devosia marina]|uniref:hypothetical protein n=1 Tax=Devosia marina TaxID=2683198 RepID=UPI0032ED02AF
MSTTVVFPGHPKHITGNPLHVETPFGKPQTISVGDACETEEILREALGEILDGPLDAYRMQKIAQDAIDAVDALFVKETNEAKASQAGAA